MDCRWVSEKGEEIGLEFEVVFLCVGNGVVIIF